MLTGPRAERQLRTGRATLAVPVLLGDIARDINRDALTVGQGKRRVRYVTAFVAGALTAPAARGR